jgi:hypothetical protein
MYELRFNGKWTIKQLEPGTLFQFPDGELALKTAYRTDEGQGICYLVDGGSALGAHISEDTEVSALRVIHNGNED